MTNLVLNSATMMIGPHRGNGAGRLRSGIALIGAAALLAGCAGSRGGPIPYGVEDFGPPDAPSSFTLPQGYQIAPLDKLKVTVFQFEDLTGEYDVDLAGNIAMPLVGTVKAVDLTTSELQKLLTQRLGEKYLQSPDVSVSVTETSRFKVTVDGSVRQPGMFPMTGKMTLMQAVAMARGVDENANPRRIAIFRQVDGQRMAAAFDLVSIRRGEAKDPQIYSGDIIVVDGSSTKEIYRTLLQTLPLVSLFRPY